MDESVLCNFDRMRSAPRAGADDDGVWVPVMQCSAEVIKECRREFVSWEAVEEHLSDLLNDSILFDGTQVLWRMDMLTFHGQTILFFRWHHAIGDGMAVGEMLASLDKTVDFNARPSLPAWSLEHVWLLLWVAMGAILVLLRWTWCKLRFPPQPRWFKVRLTGKKKIACSEKPVVGMDALKKARHLGTVNDIVLTAVNRGLARACGASKEEKGTTHLACAIPQNIRWTVEKRAILQNGVGSMSLFLPSVLASEPFAKSVERTASATSYMKRLPEAYVVGLIMRISNWLPRVWARKLFSSMSALMSLMVSNVVGHPSPLKIFGASCTLMMGFVPAPNGIAVGIGILSYSNGLYLSVNCDCGFTAASPRVLLEAIEEELRSNLC